MNGFLLVADVKHNCLKILDPRDNKWHTTIFKTNDYLYDAKQDSDDSFWLLSKVDGNHTITKYEV